MWLRKLSPMTIASKIYEASGEADLICPWSTVTPGNILYPRFAGCRNHWVKDQATRGLILNIIEVLGMPHSHALANLSVNQGNGNEKNTVAAKLEELTNEIKHYEITLRPAAVMCSPISEERFYKNGPSPGPSLSACPLPPSDSVATLSARARWQRLFTSGLLSTLLGSGDASGSQWRVGSWCLGNWGILSEEWEEGDG